MLRSRVALAVIGVIIIGGVGASLGALSAPHPTHPSASADAASATATALADAGGSPTASLTPTVTATPTVAKPTAIPTRTPRPTPTPPPVGVVITLRGTISSTNTTAQTFALRVSGGATYTVETSGATCTYAGTAIACSDLQPRMAASATGEFPTAGAPFQASAVNAQPGNN